MIYVKTEQSDIDLRFESSPLSPLTGLEICGRKTFGHSLRMHPLLRYKLHLAKGPVQPALRQLGLRAYYELWLPWLGFAVTVT